MIRKKPCSICCNFTPVRIVKYIETIALPLQTHLQHHDRFGRMPASGVPMLLLCILAMLFYNLYLYILDMVYEYHTVFHVFHMSCENQYTTCCLRIRDLAYMLFDTSHAIHE